jgi:acetyl-CoA C-acetyltransferase
MTKELSDVVITSALRTPIGTYRGSLKELSADKLGSICIKEVIKNSKLKADNIEQVVMGQVLTSATGQNPARQASVNAGMPVSKPAHIVNQLCGSGLRAVASAYQSVKLKENKIVIAGGQESMSKAPHAIFYREEQKLSEEQLVDTMIHDGLIDAFNNYHMGVTAENVAEKYKITRKEQDLFSLDSQQKTEKTIKENRFKDELITFEIKKNDKIETFKKDEYPRENLNIEKLESLKTVFKEFKPPMLKFFLGYSSSLKISILSFFLISKVINSSLNLF